MLISIQSYKLFWRMKKRISSKKQTLSNLELHLLSMGLHKQGKKSKRHLKRMMKTRAPQ